MILVTMTCFIFMAASSNAAMSDDMASLNAIDYDDGRYLVANDDGGLAMVFNSTSLLYAAIILIPIAIFVALVAVPLLGYDLGSIFRRTFATDQEYYGNYAYEGQDVAAYTDYAQRSLEILSPVLRAIDELYNRYG
ncbi:unnamed protein product [Meganyctiphanes norvegica]|uniref:Uncharacterized protein n=1 Tax=Meganyctiphanes norvegica TaxID=48144 RepID=A0AAV2RZD8_MEGNR